MNIKDILKDVKGRNITAFKKGAHARLEGVLKEKNPWRDIPDAVESGIVGDWERGWNAVDECLNKNRIEKENSNTITDLDL